MKRHKRGLYIRFFDTRDNFKHTVESDQAEWARLIKPAIDNRWPIDGATVNGALLDQMLDRDNVRAPKGANIYRIEMV